MKYDYNVSSHRRRRFRKRVYIGLTALVLLIVAIVAVIKIDNFLADDRNPESAVTSSTTTSHFASSTQIFRTPYFQIQTNKNWAEVPSESTANKFVYRSLRGNLVEHDITVYVDEIPGNVAATRALPVKFENESTELSSMNVSGHCKESNGGNTSARIQTISVGGTSISCDLDSSQYSVLVGKVGGSSVLRMKRPDGSLANYTIFYRNVTAKPDASQLYEIISTFQTR